MYVKVIKYFGIISLSYAMVKGQINRVIKILGMMLVIAVNTFAQGGDTLYPGYDLAIISINTAKKDVLPGEGVILNITVKNIGAIRSPEAKMNFYVDSTDEATLLDEINLVDFKNIIELDPQSQITFNKLIVIPGYYSKKIAYITASIPLDNYYSNDPTTQNNEKITGVRISDFRTYQGGIYSYDTYIKGADLNGLKKVTRDATIKFSVEVGNNENKPLKPGQQIEIYLSDSKTLDNKSALIGKIDFPMLRANENKKITKDIVIGRQFRKGKIYLFAKINPGNIMTDPITSNNISAPLKIKLK